MPIELPKSYDVIEIVPTKDSTFFIKVEEDFKNVLYKTSDNGFTMNRVGGGVTRGFGEFNYNNGELIVEKNDKIYIYDDEYKTYKSYSIGSVINSSNDRIHQLQTDKDGALYYILDPFTGKSKLYRFGTISQKEIQTSFTPERLDFDNLGNMYCKSVSGNLHKSTDKGNTWDIILENDRVNTLYTDKSSSNGRLYVNSVESNRYSYILYSDNQGSTWDTLTFEDIDFRSIGNFTIYDDSTLYFNATEGTFDLSSELFKVKISNGNTFQSNRMREKNRTIFPTGDFAINGRGDIISPFSNASRTYFYLKEGTWIQTKLTGEGFIKHINTIVDDDRNIYLIRIGNGIYKYNNSNKEWEILSNSSRQLNSIGGIVRIDYIDGVLIASSFERSLKSYDGGITWEPLLYYAYEVSYKYEIRNGTLIIYFDDNIITSEDVGESWEILASITDIDNLKYLSGIKTTYKFGNSYIINYEINDSLTTYITNDGKDWKKVNIDESIIKREFFLDEKNRILLLNPYLDSYLSEIKRNGEVVEITEPNDIPKYNKNNYGERGIDEIKIGPNNDVWVLGQKQYTPAIGNRLYRSEGIDSEFTEIKLNGEAIWDYSNLFFSPDGSPYLAIDGTIYKGGTLAPWQEISDYSNKEPSSINSLVSINDEIWFSSSDKQIYNSTNDGEKWIRYNEGLVEPVYGLISSEAGSLFNFSQFGIFKYQGSGTWKHTSFGLPIPSSVYDVAENNNGRLLAAVFGRGVFYSDNDGELWRSYANNLNLYVRSVTSFSNQVFAATNQGIFRTNDEFTQWQNISENLGDISFSLVYFHNDILYAQTEQGFHKTEIGQINWLPEEFDDKSLEVNSLFTDEQDQLFACTNNGLYKLKNNNWELFGLNGFDITAMSENSKYYFASTQSKVYRLNKTISDVAENTQNISYKVFPNPTFDKMCLNYSNQLETQFQIYNLDQSLMIEGILSKNENCIDVSNLSSGVYILILNEEIINFIKMK